MNVLNAAGVPGVMNLKQVLGAFLDHRFDVLRRRTAHRLGQIAHRLEVLGGYLVAYLNLDEVIRIIRSTDEPRPKLMTRFKISEVQAEAILNMRLRALRKLEEIEIRGEFETLITEQANLKKLQGSKDRQKKVLAKEIAAMKRRFGPATELGRRRTEIAAPPDPLEVPTEALVEREPITILCSAKGWIRAVKGHLEAAAPVKYKEGDRERFRFHGETTDRLVLFATNGRFYALSCDKLPGGRGLGEPVRLMIDLAADQDVVKLFVHRPGQRLLVAASDGRGFVVEEDGVLAEKRTGKQVLNPGRQAEACICVPAVGDCVAVVGENRRLLLFPAADVPVLARGRGVILQRYRDGGLGDAKLFNRAEGLSWKTGAGVRNEGAADGWHGKRGQAGRVAPRGFPKSNKFG
jgi:topoisomerase-4 subunit A